MSARVLCFYAHQAVVCCTLLTLLIAGRAQAVEIGWKQGNFYPQSLACQQRLNLIMDPVSRRRAVS